VLQVAGFMIAAELAHRVGYHEEIVSVDYTRPGMRIELSPHELSQQPEIVHIPLLPSTLAPLAAFFIARPMVSLRIY
jgi:hypothetical protein